MELTTATLTDNVHRAASAAAILRRKSVPHHLHLLHGEERQRAENRLPAPSVIAGGAIHFKPGLAAARTVGGGQGLIHENVALINSRTISCVQQRKVCDLAIEKRRLLHLFFG